MSPEDCSNLQTTYTSSCVYFPWRFKKKKKIKQKVDQKAASSLPSIPEAQQW